MKELDIAFSPCPNDTFVFHAMLHGLVDTRDLRFNPNIDDVETLNEKAFLQLFHVTKLSFAAYFNLTDYYDLLDSGAALGYGCGPLVVACKDNVDLGSGKIAVPGRYTTANLLLKLWHPGPTDIVYTSFNGIMEGVQSGRYDAGVIIHEGRFVYENYDLVKIIDLGEWWEKETGMPIPLGCIAVRKDPETVKLQKDIESVIKASADFALKNRGASRDFVRSYAKELDDRVIDNHITLYVNEFTLSLGQKGREAINVLMEMVRKKKVI